MRTFTTIIFLMFLFLIMPSNDLAQPKLNNQIVIRVSEEGWGDSNIEDIETVLYSTANDLLKYFPNKRLKPIIVEYDKNGPVTLYRKGFNGEYIIQLSAKDHYWSQFAYQFSHELGHVLSNYENTRIDENPNQWFEEALAETASFFTMRQMATTWKTSPPYPNWKSYAPSLYRYVENIRSNKNRQLPLNMTLAQWYKSNSKELREDYLLRDKNGVAASQLLTLFEQSPQSWDAINYLNLGKPDATHSFENYLNNWYSYAPEKHKKFISKIINMFKQ